MAFCCPAWSLLSETRDNTTVAQASPDLTRIQHISERASTHGIFHKLPKRTDLSVLYADHSGFGSFDTLDRGELPSTAFALVDSVVSHVCGRPLVRALRDLDFSATALMLFLNFTELSLLFFSMFWFPHVFL
ncbi:hypothetical protein FocnCong_v009107 [Fusarium oxysporum f. sp. conglutinans]|nr:hypothetical protein FocnCong_v009107 [Fusarium oxysporum f. sp. conglutinans]